MRRSSAAKTLIEMAGAELREVSDLQFWGPHGAAHRRGTSRVLERGAFTLSSVEKPNVESVITAQVGDSVWVIEPDTPVLKLGALTYVFPRPANFYVVIFSGTTEPEALGILDALLERLSLFQEAKEAMHSPEVQEAEAVAAAALDAELAAAAERAQGAGTPGYASGKARAVHRLASKTASGIMISSMWLSNSMRATSSKFSTPTKGAPPRQEVKLSDAFKRRMDRTARASRSVSRATHNVAHGIAWVATKLASPLLRLFGLTKRPAPGEAPTGAQEVTHATASGITQVYDALEQAGYLVLTTARDGAAGVAEHRYGGDAGEVTRSGMTAGVYAVDSAMSFSGGKVAREAAKRTATNVLRDIGRR